MADALERLGRSATVVRGGDREITELDGDLVRGLAVERTGAQELEVWDCTLQPSSHTVVHKHDAEQVIVVIDGVVTVEIDGERRDVECGDAVVIPPHTFHQLHSGPKSNRHLGICGRVGTRTILEDGEEVTPTWQS
jgi:quercetin dioxygenase-like cupin family protein